MTIKVSKPEVNIREKLAELDKPSGIKGTQVLRAETADEVRDAIGARGRKNLIINGGFDVWQRGTSGTTGFVADRWYVSNSSASTKDGNSLKMVSTSTDPYFIYHVEDVGMRLADKQVTMSFWIKTSTGKNDFQYLTYTGSGHYYPQTVGSVDSDGFQKYEVTFSLDSTYYTDRHRFIFELEPTSGITIWIKEVQLELGDTATDFEHRSYGEELALCQRYCYVVKGDGGDNTLGIGAAYSTTAVNYNLHLPVPLRGVPTPTASGTWLNSYVGASGQTTSGTPAVGEGTDQQYTCLRLFITGLTGLTAGEAAWGLVQNGTHLILDAEL